MKPSRKFRLQKWFWISNLPAVSYLYFFQSKIWEKVSVFYLIIISILTPILGAATGEQTAEGNEMLHEQNDSN